MRTLPRRHILTAVTRRGSDGHHRGVAGAVGDLRGRDRVVRDHDGNDRGPGVGLRDHPAPGLRRQTIPAVLVLAMFGLTIKTLVGVVSGSTFAYFVQPVTTTVAVGTSSSVRCSSAVRSSPASRTTSADLARSRVAASVVRLFAGLTVLWATVQLVNAGATLGMLFSMPTTLFVVLKPAASLLVSTTAVVITVCWALRTAHREELVFAKA